MAEGASAPALQVVVLGSGGGPIEDNTTAFLVRSLATNWRKGSVLAVDAGTHLAAISRILQPYIAEISQDGTLTSRTLTKGPFAGLELPADTVQANAAHITRKLVDTYLITHPHLDHICGFVVNTAALPGSRPKRLAGLPSTISAFKTHIFNNIIWPNLSDENNGAGLVTYMRLVDGGSPAIGDGEHRGYVEICEGLSVKTWSVSHGHCIEQHKHRGSNAGLTPTGVDFFSRHYPATPRRGSQDSQVLGGTHERFSPRDHMREEYCVYDSSAYFIRDISTGREVLIFGDVEPDSISLHPRNVQVWNDAAPKITAGQLGGIFIECSYDDSQSDETLFGHLAPRFLIEELKSLATTVAMYKAQKDREKVRVGKRKRGQTSISWDQGRRQSPRTNGSSASGHGRNGSGTNLSLSPRSQGPLQLEFSEADGIGERGPDQDVFTKPLLDPASITGQLKGVKIVLIHLKEKLLDGPQVQETVLQQLLKYDQELQLGCEFIVSRVGEAIYL